MTKPNNKGVALIAAVVTAVIFLMLVMTVMVVSISTYKKSGQGHDRAMALYLAEAGINETLYRMNYRHYLDPPDATYPADLQYLNFAYVSATDAVVDTLWQALLPPLHDPFGVGLGNGYFVQFFANGVNPNDDELRSTGIYNGKRRVVSVNIRGTNTPAAALNTPTHGIAEAFNKHAVYAREVNYTAGTVVVGNVITESVNPGTVADRTWTRVNPINDIPDVNINAVLDMPGDPGELGCTERYILGTDTVGGNAFPVNYPSSTYFGGVYNFNGDTVANSVETDGNIVFSGTNTVSNFVRVNSGTITMGGTMTINANAAFFAAGGITVDGLITQAAGTGVIAVRDSNLTLSGGPSNINITGSSTKNAAIMLYTTGVHTLTVNIAPTITLNSDNQAGCLVYSSSGWPVGTNSVSLTSGLTLTTPFNCAPTAVVAYSLSENARISINTGETINGLIYAVSGGDSAREARIVLTAGIVGDVTYGGLLVAGGTVNAAPARARGIIDLISGTVRFRGGNYYAFSQLFNVYSNLFSDGQRVYLPVPGSWREE